MSNTINSRIMQIVKMSGLSITAYSKKIRIAQTSLRGVCIENSEPRYSTLEKIIIAEPLVSLEWLLTGEGEMLKDSKDNTANEVTKNDVETDSYLVKELLDALKRRDEEIKALRNEKKVHAPLEGNAADADVS